MHYMPSLVVFSCLDLDDPEFFIHFVGTGKTYTTDSCCLAFCNIACSGETISSVGRYVKKYNIHTEIVLEGSEFSAFYDYVVHATSRIVITRT